MAAATRPSAPPEPGVLARHTAGGQNPVHPSALAARALVQSGRFREDLYDRIGRPMLDPTPAPEAAASPGQRRRSEAHDADLTRKRPAIEDALRAADGNISVAARALGVHRSQRRRWLTHLGITTGAAK